MIQGNAYSAGDGRGFMLLFSDDGSVLTGTYYDYQQDGSQVWLTIDPPDNGAHILRRPKGSGFVRGSYEGAGDPFGTVEFTRNSDGSIGAALRVRSARIEVPIGLFGPFPPEWYEFGLQLVPVVG